MDTSKPADYGSLDPLRRSADTASQEAVNQQAAGALLPGMLRDALTKKFTDNNPLITQRGTALTGYMTAAEGAANEQRAVQQSGNPYSPTQLRSLQGQREAAALVPLVGINYLLGQQTGTIGDVIDATTGAFQANTAAAQGAAGIARTRYQDELDRLDRQQSAYEATQKLIAEAMKPDNAFVDAGGRQLLVDKKTGQVIADLGSSTAGKGGESQADAAWAQIAAAIRDRLIGQQSGGSGADGKPTAPPSKLKNDPFQQLLPQSQQGRYEVVG